MAPHQNVVILRVLIAWNQMHMEVEYCLSCNFVIILKNIKSNHSQEPLSYVLQASWQASWLFLQLPHRYHRYPHSASSEESARVLLTPACIENHLKCVILIDRVGRNLSRNNLTKNTVCLSHNMITPFLHLSNFVNWLLLNFFCINATLSCVTC